MQGSGKGTQAKILTEVEGYKVFETGAQLRQLRELDTPLASEVREILAAGNLVSQEVVMSILEEFLRTVPANQPVIYDGIPRNLEQKIAFDQMLEKYDRMPIALQIDLDRETALTRMRERGRDDDTEEAMQQRLLNFQALTQPVIEAYDNEVGLITVDGRQSIAEVSVNIITRLRESHTE